jgi:hypothetical protein
MADIRMANVPLETDISELNTQGGNMSSAITEFTALVKANLADFKGLSAGQLTTTARLPT